jgi:carboxymethylenebutenolidase
MKGTASSQWIELAAPDGGGFKAFLALPPAPKGPGILLLQEIFGVNRHIRAVAEQYAMVGFVVLAPDVFWRQQAGLDIGYGAADVEHGRALKQQLDLAQATGDLAAAAGALRARPECTGRIASLGYCMGGMLSFLCAAEAAVDAAVCYYGSGIDSRTAQLACIRCPMLMHFAAQDELIPVQAVDRIREALKEHADAAIHLYPGVGHGFNCWDRAAYHAMSAALARGRTLQFLSTRLGR